MTDRHTSQGQGGAEPTDRQLPTSSNEANSSRRVSGQQPQRHRIIYTYSPKTIHVEAHEFKGVVQRLTGKDSIQNDWAQNHSAVPLAWPSHSSHQSQEASEGSIVPEQAPSADSGYALEEYLDKLDRENPSPEPAVSNLGLFPTAGLVKGVDLDLGLRWQQVVSSTASTSSSGPSDSYHTEFSACNDDVDDKYINSCVNYKLGRQFSKRCQCRESSRVRAMQYIGRPSEYDWAVDGLRFQQKTSM